MRRGKENHNQTSRLKRPSEDLKLAECPRFVEPKQLKQIWVLVKSLLPEFVEPKQLEQTRVLVKHARLTAKRSTTWGDVVPFRAALKRFQAQKKLLSFRMKLEIFGYLAWKTKDERKKRLPVSQRSVEACEEKKRKMRERRSVRINFHQCLITQEAGN